MANEYKSSRFGGPSDAIDMEKLEKETQKLFFLGLLVAVSLHAAAASFFMFKKTEVKVVKPPTMELVIRETYIVKKGDTLWDISERFLGNPFDWPEVWKKNEFIVNPDLIYPGQTIGLKAMIKQVLEQNPPLRVENVIEKKPVEKPQPLFTMTAPESVDSLQVVLRGSLKTGQDDSTVIELLREPREIYTEQSFMRTGFIRQRSELPKPKVVGIEEEKNSATKFDVVIIDIGNRDGVKEGDIYAAIEVGEPVKHPDTGKGLGLVVRIKGVLRAVSVAERQARCLVMENFDPIEINDPVMPYRISRGPRFDAWVKPDMSIIGTILAIQEPMLSIHVDDILYMDKGQAAGVRPGDRFVIYGNESSKDTGDFKKPLGIVEAINVMTNETAVIVVSLNGEHVEIGDRVVLTARCRLVQ